MRRLFWAEDRLSWPFVIAVGLLTLSFLILDFVWRTFVMPFETLLIYAAIGNAAVAIIFVGTCLYLRGAVRARRGR